MKVYIVHRDVDYEFGYVDNVCSTREEAEKSIKDSLAENESGDPEEWSIDEWDLGREAEQEQAKRLCLERDGFHCRHCGVADGVSAIRITVDKFNEYHLSNLISLCEECRAEKEKIESTDSDGRVGVILAGGKGTRLMPLTRFFNKHELPISLTPMLLYPLKTIRALGVKRCLIVMDRDNTSRIISMLGSGKEFGMDISYKVQEGAGGISDALYLARDFAESGDEIVCILGDNIFDNDAIETDIDLSVSKACVFLKEIDNPKAYGVATVVDGKVAEIVEKPTEPKSNLAVVGLYAYTYDVFSVIDSIKPSGRGELEISAVNDHYAKAGELSYKMVEGYWADCGGSIQRYAEASMHGAKQAKVSADELREFVSVVFDEK